MNKLRVALAAAVLTFSAFAQDTGTTPTEESAVQLPTQSSSGWCWVYLVGRWYLLPC
jgi:hypothetical protein